jgi:hypothetical protein
MSTPASVVLGSTAGGAAVATGGVAAAANGVAAAAGAPAAIHLPSAGSGGHAAPSTSISFMLVAGMLSALAGAFLFVMGRRRELENDGLR